MDPSWPRDGRGVCVRLIEKQIESAEKDRKKVFRPSISTTPRDYKQHIRLMGDLMAQAFQADVTRVATNMIANVGSNRTYKNIGVPDDRHLAC